MKYEFVEYYEPNILKGFAKYIKSLSLKYMIHLQHLVSGLEPDLDKI